MGLESTLKWKYTLEISDQIIFSSEENQKYSEKIPKNIRKFPQYPVNAVNGKRYVGIFHQKFLLARKF